MTKMNTIEMILAQKVAGREVAKTVVLNKVDGNKPYELTDINTEEGTFTFTEMLPPDSTETPKVVKVTKANAAAFSYNRNPNPKPAPEATIENGVLVIKNKKILMGAIKADRVLGGIAGKVIFLNGNELMSYDVQFDKFSTIGNVYDTDAVLYNIENMAIIVENRIEAVPQYDKDGNPIIDENGDQVTKPKFKSCVMSQCEGGTLRSYGELDYNYYYDDDEDYEDYKINRPVSSIRVVEYGHRKAIIAVMTKDVDKDGYVVDGSPRVVIINTDGYNLQNIVTSLDVEAADTKIYLGGKPNSETITAINTSEFILMDNCGIKRVTDPSIVAELQGYKYFCNETAASTDDGTEVIITFANDNYECKSFKLLKTKDRGDIYSMV